MKNTLLIGCLLIMAAGSALSQPKGLKIKNEKGETKLLGQTTVEQLKKEPFQQWFKPNYKVYNPADDLIAKLSVLKDGFDSVTLFMGTWCKDSRREVPRFYKLLDELKFDRRKIKLVTVDRTFQNYKQSPGREEVGQNIHRVPTFIFHKNAEEIGRIVESPKESLEKDMLAILKNEDYVPNYQVVQALEDLFETHEPASLLKMKDSLALLYKDKVMNRYELNTYGLVLFSSFQMAEARVVYEINRLIFPGDALPHVSIARFELVLGNKQLALDRLEKALVTVPGNPEIQDFIASIKGE